MSERQTRDAGGESFRLIHRPRFYYFAEFRMMYGRRGYMALPCFYPWQYS